MVADWYEVVVEVAAEFGDAVANFLIDSGAPGLQTEDRDGTTVLTAHFETDPPIESLQQFCGDLGCGLSADRIHVRRIADEDWAENWKRHIQPQCVGERLYICPSWTPTRPIDRIAVIIDPGMAFGTGQHASTRGCLQLLERAVRERSIDRALDVGTGSGVLAIALVKLGVINVWAVDNDPNACVIAAANAGYNHVDAHVHVVAQLDDVPGTFDLIVANLFANLLTELAPQLVRRLRPGATLIVSGFLAEDAERVHSAYAVHDLDTAARYEEHPWVTIAMRRRRGE